LTIATRAGLPTSSTHTIVGSVIGIGVAVLGTNGIRWGWDGLGEILASWVIAPVIAGAGAAFIFLVTKYTVLKRKNSLRAGLMMTPIYFSMTTGILTVLLSMMRLK
jgi:solute carrier family 20 (sodium-dependent phosphate transporter)